MLGKIGDYLEKIYIIKPGETTHTFKYNYMYARWVSPRFSSIKVDRYIDVPYANMTFLSIYAIGDNVSGERFLEIGVFGFPKTIRCPFTSLSANEFRFPSKNVDTNLRHVGFEILDKCRFIAMPEETFRFLNQKGIKTFESDVEATMYVSMLFSSIERKLPFKCQFCKKILWLYGDKVPDNPTKAKCPVCQSTFLLSRPKDVDFDLIRFVSPETSSFEKEKAIVTSDGEIKIVREVDDISASNSKITDESPGSDSLVDVEGESKIEENKLLEESPQEELSELEDELSISDDFIDDILPDEFKEGGTDKNLEYEDKDKNKNEVQEEENVIENLEGITCPVCGKPVSKDAAICPSCGAELALNVSGEVLEQELASTSSKLDIKLKDEDVSEKPVEGAEEFKEEIEEKLEEKEKEINQEEKKTPFWEEKIWSVKIDDDIYDNLDLVTLEDWVLSRDLLEEDLVKKGEEGKWRKAKDLPYLKTAFERVRNALALGVDVSAAAFFPARNIKRIIAFLIDAVIIGILGGMGYFFLPKSMINNLFMKLLYINFLPLIYLTIMTTERGQTFGKMLLGLHVIAKDAKPPTFSKSLLRALIWLFSAGTFGVLFLIGLIHPKKKAFHDIVADTYVVEYE